MREKQENLDPVLRLVLLHSYHIFVSSFLIMLPQCYHNEFSLQFGKFPNKCQKFLHNYNTTSFGGGETLLCRNKHCQYLYKPHGRMKGCI